MLPKTLFLLFAAFSSHEAVAQSSLPDLASCRQGPVTVFAEPRSRALACRAAQVAADLHERIRSELSLSREVPVSIILATPGLAADTLPLDPDALAPWLAGAAVAARQVILVRLPAGATVDDQRALLAHELTHVILKADYPLSAGWPRWFQEGLAMRQSRGEGLRLHASLSLAAARGRLLPLDSLWSAFPSHQAGSRVAYAQSFSVISYLVSRHGEKHFADFMRELRNREFEEAFVRVYGYRLGRMEKEWRRYVKLRYSWIPLATGGTAFWILIITLFFVALAARKRRSRELHRQWAEEDPGE